MLLKDIGCFYTHELTFQLSAVPLSGLCRKKFSLLIYFYFICVILKSDDKNK